jgi:archaellum component FlaF (FlaF/FlaG flagellin family)
MGIVLAAAMLIGMFVVVGLTMPLGLIGAGLSQGEALREYADAEGESRRTSIKWIAVYTRDTVSSSVVTIQAENDGSVPVVDRDMMDVIFSYTAIDDQATLIRLGPSATTSPGVNEWSITSISPDQFNPAIWDPGETATLMLRVSPLVKKNATATVAIVAPTGADLTQSFVYE